MPNLLRTPSTSRRVSFIVLISVTCAVTSCARSLSPVEISTGTSRALACAASVPITSSASTPGTHSSGSPIACTMPCSGSTCARNSSGIGGRWALYPAKISSRKVLPLASNTTTTGAPGKSLRSLRSIETTPRTAPVGRPEEVESGGSAWKAR